MTIQVFLHKLISAYPANSGIAATALRIGDATELAITGFGLVTGRAKARVRRALPAMLLIRGCSSVVPHDATLTSRLPVWFAWHALHMLCSPQNGSARYDAAAPISGNHA